MYPNTVINHTVCDTDLFIIGEHANSSESGKLCVNVIEEEQPDLVCIESCPEKFDFYSGTGYQSTVGAFAAEQYCRETGSELYLADVLQSEASLELQLLPDSETLDRDRPEFDMTQITEDGGIKSKEYIDSYVEKNKLYNKERYKFIWETRENFISNSVIQKIKSGSYQTVVLIVGLSHLFRISDLITDIDTTTINVDSDFLTKRSFTLEFINLLEQRDEDTFYEED